MAKASITYAKLVGAEQTDFGKVGKVTTGSVFKGSGKHWKEWIRILDKKGARAWSYGEIVAFLKKTHKLTPWWQHGVALGFEIATGRRKEGQDAKGKYMVTATKSFSLTSQKIWTLLVSEAGVQIWLSPLAPIKLRPGTAFETKDGFFGEIRTLTQPRRIRLMWQDPEWEKHTFLELLLVNRPGKKSILVFNHTGLKDAESKARLGERWRKIASALAEMV